MANDARTQAFFLLNKLDQRKHTLDYYLEELDRKAILPDQRERGLLNALVYGVLRQRALLDYILKHFSAKPLNSLDYEVRNILRLALFQIVFMDRIPESAAVNTAVEITKKYKPKAAGFVNAVLRKSIAGYKQIAPPDPSGNPVQYFSVTYGLPQWLASRWLKRFGLEAMEKLCAGLNEVPPLSLRVNTLKTDVAALAKELLPVAAKVTPGAYAASAVNITKPNLPVYELPGYAEGLFLVQDEAAQLTVALVDPQPGEKLLDACAGIGGKTLSMLIAGQNQVKITATDQTLAKLERIKAESQRLGLCAPETKTVDWLKPLSEITARLGGNPERPHQFDKVLVDAPCSGLGVLRRNPDTKWTRRESDLTKLAQQQLNILQNAAHFVNPGGYLIYTVCSTEPEETYTISEKFLKNNAAFYIDNVSTKISNRLMEKMCNNGTGLCTYPHLTDMDGFFMVRFKRHTNI